MNITKYAALGSLVLLTNGVLSNISPAAAATFNAGSELKISGTLDVRAFGTTVADPDGGTIPTTSFDFHGIGGSSASPGVFTLLQGTDSFAVHNPPPQTYGHIKDLLTPTDFPEPLGGPGATVAKFMSFSSTFPVDSTKFTTFFDLTEIVDVDYVDTGTGVTTGLGVKGFFYGSDDESVKTFGTGVFSADIDYGTIDGVNNFAEYIDYISTEGNKVENIAFSGDFVIPAEAVPEASNIAGLLAFGLAGCAFIARKRKQKQVNLN
ncbi:MAG: hypothetical protein F6K10_40500 [Moorea sp. SIO2B7]|nr:hypothetical protein [Moorena sp. SIO2B7]